MLTEYKRSEPKTKSDRVANKFIYILRSSKTEISVLPLVFCWMLCGRATRRNVYLHIYIHIGLRVLFVYVWVCIHGVFMCCYTHTCECAYAGKWRKFTGTVKWVRRRADICEGWCLCVCVYYLIRCSVDYENWRSIYTTQIYIGNQTYLSCVNILFMLFSWKGIKIL